VIEIEYVVRDQKGIERLRTTDKKAADAYDRALETAERLADLLRHDRVLPDLAEHDLEELTIYLARNARSIERILKGKGPEFETAPGPEVVETKDKVTKLRAAG
jgi:dsDNA-binding SOS-regulon protein